MDVAKLSMALSKSNTQHQASLSVMKMGMGNAEQQGETIQELLSSADVKVIQHAAQPHLGGNIDLRK
ncbi:YjfB family protein [Priestia flexa]|uniref:YjfB family protein n=1 Tax=Priestia flexa TaxID=86664 RepID=UPI0009548C89|nr:YjfB family protein [Priestia flexa]SIQ04032.1 Putative motility protein [Priestia flexa]